MKSILSILFVSASLSIAAQNINMNTSGTVNQSRCGNSVFDSGGNGSDYSNSESGILVLCPTTATSKVILTFSSFDLENNFDFLRIYDGDNIGATLLATLTGGTNPGIIQATLGNATGCLTLRFTSDFNLFGQTHNGFAAAISCTAPCQSILSNFVSSSPAPDGASIIKSCQNQSVNFVGSGTFGTSSTGATYSWNFGDGTTAAGANVNHTYTTGGSYLVNLTITDPAGCKNTNFLNRLVQISTTPTISTSATPSPLCTNQFSALNAAVTMVTSVPSCTPPVSGVTFLPDGTGTSYTTTITTDCYPTGSTITSAADFVNLCINMEHSWIGDLGISFICPNNQAISLKTYGTGTASYYLGSPIDDDFDLTAGTGRQYCFTPGASTLLINGALSAAGTPSNSSIVAGNYMPAQPFSGLIGCPLNGVWTIRITDNIGSDNGYIFNWDFTLNPALTGLPSFTPAIVSQGWTPQTYLYPVNSTQANVVATTMATHNFTYTVTDNFGCTYNAPQSVVVNCTSLPTGLVSFDAKALSDNRVDLRWVTGSEHNTNRFEIDRSTDGENWSLVTAAEAAGDSENELVYSSMDSEPETGVSYYRLRTIDNDGAQQVSDIDVVTINTAGGVIVVYPNPASDALTIEGNEADLETLAFINSLGQDITSMVGVNAENPSKLQLDISGLARSTYTIKTVTSTYLFVKK